jgi:hypothetical protein
VITQEPSARVAHSFDNLVPYVSQAFGLTTEELERACRPAIEADLPRVLALRRAVTPRTWWNDEEFVRWRYFGRRTDDDQIPFWVFDHAGEILGACGLEPVTLTVDGLPLSAVRGMDIMVRPDIDGRGLGMFMNVVLFRQYPVIIVTGSNASSHQLLSRMYRHTLDLVFWKSLIESRELIERRSVVRPLAGILAAGANVVLRMQRRGRRAARPPGMDIRILPRFDDQVTDLAMRLELPGRIIVRRSAEYLNWRFIENPRCRYTIFAAFVNGVLEGYMVTRLNLARPNPRREGEIVDWLAAGASGPTSPLPALLSAAGEHLVAAGAGLVTCAAHGAEIETAADINGFRFREGQRIPFFVRAASAPVHRRLSSAHGWFLTRGDLDVE